MRLMSGDFRERSEAHFRAQVETMRDTRRIGVVTVIGAVAVGVLAIHAPAAHAVSNRQDKIDICHIPPANPGHAQTITIGASALPAHLAHGDMLGPCQNDCRLFGISCDDGDACTFDSCGPMTGACLHGEPMDCDDGDVCTDDSCDPATVECRNVVVPLGSPRPGEKTV